MDIYICGTRGSTPAPGPQFVRYGGNTSCVAVAHSGERPALVIDAGTGLTRLSERFAGTAFRGTILLSHLHWDHTHGLPFFPAGDRLDSKIDLYLPRQEPGDAEAVLGRVISPPHFPITPSQLRGDWRFLFLDPGAHELEGFAITALEIPHKGGRTYGFRVSDGTSAVAYMSDHWPTSVGPGPDGLGEYHRTALDLAADVDLLIHDAQYVEEDMATKGEFGHSAIPYAIGLAEKAAAKKLLLFHHDPWRDDEAVDRLLERYQPAPVAIDAACEGEIIRLPALPPDRGV